MKILHVNEHSLPKGGAEVYLLELIQRFQDKGHACHLAYAKDQPTDLPASVRLPVIGKVHTGDDQGDLQGLKNYIEEHDPDLIHFHGLWNLEVIETCLAMKPCMMTSHDYRWLCPDSKFYWKRSQAICPKTAGWSCAAVTLKHKCLTVRPHLMLRHIGRINRFKKHLPRMRAIVAPSHFAADRLDKEGYPKSKTHVLPYFCSFEPLASPRPIPEKKCLAYIGRIADYKGIEYFVEAIRQLPDDVEGRVMGDVVGAKGDKIMQTAREKGCHQRIRLIPWADREGVQALLMQTSILIFPSIWPETLGIIGLEAMAMGVPVIGSSVGGIGDWLQHERTGFLSPPKNAEQIVRYAEQLLSDPDLMQSMGAASLESIRQHYQPDLHLQKLEEIYRSCL